METLTNSESTKDISDMYILNRSFSAFLIAVFASFSIRSLHVCRATQYLQICCL